MQKIWHRLKILFLIGRKDIQHFRWNQKNSESDSINNSENFSPQEKTSDPEIQNLLRDYELWGPFLFTLIFSLLASYDTLKGSHQTVFIIYICLISFFNFIFYFNARLLRAKISFLQMVSVLGYSLFPHVISALIWRIFRAVFGKFLIFLVVLGVMAFGGLVSYRLLRDVAPKGKVWLLLYPVLGYHLLLCFSLVSGGTE